MVQMIIQNFTSFLIHQFHKLKIGVTSRTNLETLYRKQSEYDLVQSNLATAENDHVLILELVKIGAIEPAHHQDLVKVLKSSKSQLRQEVFCLIQNNWKRGGYFVEFGALDGIDDSNTLALENVFNWTGILAEPNVNFARVLQTNRKCIVETVAVGGESQVSRSFINYGNLSTFAEYADKDSHKRDGVLTHIEVITLTELLERNNAPKVIDFLSIDTEGSELEILTTFNFAKYQFNFICVEHNFTQTKFSVLDLLSNNGYREVWPSYSKFDSFFVPK